MAAVAAGMVLGFLTARAAEGARALPEPIARMIAALYPDAEMVAVTQERDDGTLEFDIKLRQRASGRPVEIEAEEGAGIVEIDEEIAPDELPEPIQRRLQSAFPKASVQRVIKTADTKHLYEVSLLLEGRRHQVTLSTRGKVLEVDRKD